MKNLLIYRCCSSLVYSGRGLLPWVIIGGEYVALLRLIDCLPFPARAR